MVIALLISIGLIQILGLYAGMKAYRSVHSRIHLFLAGDGSKSEFTELIDATSQVLASRISSSMLATMRGASGGTTKAINKALEEEAISQDPGLSMVDMVAPQLTKKLGKNPLAMLVLQNVVNKMISGSGIGSGGYSSGSGNNHGSGQVKFNL